MEQSTFLIAAPSSGCGKTTISLGLMRALSRRGKIVQPFKCGPDYIDTMHHCIAAYQQSFNLDLFLSSGEHVSELFYSKTARADVAVTEAVMGLFDGAKRMQGSSAEIAELLKLPVILIVNGKSVAYSIAPLLYGYKHFYPQIHIAGVVFNYVNSPSHYQFLKEAADDVGITSLGYLPVCEGIKIKSRHLGLSIDEADDFNAIIDRAADHVEKYIDIEQLLLSTKRNISTVEQAKPVWASKMIVAVARDEAFNFAYAENLAAISQFAQLRYFSPLHDAELPEADLVYFAGGYPEYYSKQLSENTSMLQSVLSYCEAGGNLLAECGGMMYLGKQVCDLDGNIYPMAGALDIDISMHNMRVKLGYRKLNVNGKEFRGHEFHYSEIVRTSEPETEVSILSARDAEVQTSFFTKQGIRASYIHFYWAHCAEEFFETLFDMNIRR